MLFMSIDYHIFIIVFFQNEPIPEPINICFGLRKHDIDRRRPLWQRFGLVRRAHDEWWWKVRFTRWRIFTNILPGFLVSTFSIPK